MKLLVSVLLLLNVNSIEASCASDYDHVIEQTVTEALKTYQPDLDMPSELHVVISKYARLQFSRRNWESIKSFRPNEAPPTLESIALAKNEATEAIQDYLKTDAKIKDMGANLMVAASERCSRMGDYSCERTQRLSLWHRNGKS